MSDAFSQETHKTGSHFAPDSPNDIFIFSFPLFVQLYEAFFFDCKEHAFNLHRRELIAATYEFQWKKKKSRRRGYKMVSEIFRKQDSVIKNF